MAVQSNMRASDADRAQIVDHLRRATDEGRLLAHEFDERLGQALVARTYGELDALVADLPCQPDLVKRPGRARMTLRRRRAALIAVAASGLATAAVAIGSFTAPGVMTSRPSARVLNATTGTTVAVSPPPRAPYGTTGTTTAASPPSR